MTFFGFTGAGILAGPKIARNTVERLGDTEGTFGSIEGDTITRSALGVIDRSMTNSDIPDHDRSFMYYAKKALFGDSDYPTPTIELSGTSRAEYEKTFKSLSYNAISRKIALNQWKENQRYSKQNAMRTLETRFGIKDIEVIKRLYNTATKLYGDFYD